MKPFNLKNFDPRHWVKTMKAHGKEFSYADGKTFTCMMFENELDIVCMGHSEKSLNAAIRDCAEEFGKQNLMKYIEKYAEKSRQRANVKSANEIIKNGLP